VQSELRIADEPDHGPDVTIRLQILDLSTGCAGDGMALSSLPTINLVPLC
jgi:ABC-type dipeptide/oligopeptide/nickel transport system ATPase component